MFQEKHVFPAYSNNKTDLFAKVRLLVFHSGHIVR